MRGVVLLFVFACGCAAHEERSFEFLSKEATTKSVCEVMADPRPYVGQRIIIRGIYFQEPHQRLLVDEGCPQWDLRVRHSLQTAGNARAQAIIERISRENPRINATVVYTGIVTANVVISGCQKPSCYRYSLEDSRLLAASQQGTIAAGPAEPVRGVNCLDLIWEQQQQPDKRFDVGNDRSGDGAISCATLTSPSAFARALSKVSYQVRSGASGSLIDTVDFPLTFIDKSGVRTHLTRAQLSEKRALVFNPETLNLLGQIRLSDMEAVNNKGGMFLSGALWFQARHIGDEPRITTINHQALAAAVNSQQEKPAH